MTDAPERIWAWPSDVTPPDETALAGTWGVSRYHPEAEAYTRDDIAWNEALDAAAKLLEGVLDDGPAHKTARVIYHVRLSDIKAIRAMKREPK